MKRIFLLGFFVFAVHRIVEGDTFQSCLQYLPTAKDVYVVTVKAEIPWKQVAFTVNEVLCGKFAHLLILTPWGERYSIGAYLLLISDSKGNKNLVGLDTQGDRCGWIPVSIERKDGQSFIRARAEWVDGIDLDMASDGTKGLTLDHLRQLLKKKVRTGEN